MRKRVGGAAAVIAALAVAAAPAMASHGGGGSGGGGNQTPPPAGAPVATFSATSVNYGAQALGTASAPQTVTITNTGSASLFINGVSLAQGPGAADFHETGGDCIAATIPVGGSCSILVFFQPTVTGTRTATITVLDTAANSPTALTYTGIGTSAAGPTPISVDTSPFFACANGVCDLGDTPLVNDFYFASFSAAGDFPAPATFSVAAGALPPGTVLQPNGTLTGFPSQAGTFAFTIRVTDAAGGTATQAFTQTIRPVPPAGDPRCTHSPGEPGALAGAAIGGKAPSGQANIDTSKFTACGGFYTIAVSVKNVNLPNGSVLWATLSGRPIGEITLANGAGSTRPYVYDGSLRKLAIQIYSHIPPLGVFESPILTSTGFFV